MIINWSGESERIESGLYHEWSEQAVGPAGIDSALTYLEYIARENRINWYGIEWQLRREFLGWTLHSGSVYKTTWPPAGDEYVISAMYQNGVALTAGTSATLSAGQYWHNRSVKPYTTYVRMSDSSNPYSKIVIGHFTARFCGGTPLNKISSDLNNVQWRPYITMASAPIVSQAIGNVLTGTAVFGTIRIGIQNADGFFDSLFDDWLWKDSTCDFLHGDGGVELSYAQHRKVSLVCASVEGTDRQIDAIFEARLQVLNRPVLTEFYSRADYPNMDPSLEGKWIAELYGRKKIPFHCVDTNLGVFKGPNRGVDAIRGVQIHGRNVAYTQELSTAKVTITSNIVSGVTATAKAGGEIATGSYFVRVAARTEKVI